MSCPRCETSNPEYARYCLNCGTVLSSNPPLTCPRCSTGLPAHAKFCIACGLSLDNNDALNDGESPDTLERLMRGQTIAPPHRLESRTARERRVVTILFADVKGFTAMSERFDPEEVVEIMQGAFNALTEPIHRYEGTLVQLMGDAILAFFGAPRAHEDDPERACRAALDILAGIRRYADQLERERGIENFSVRVGINTGLVVVGEVGVNWHTEYTATGDPINMAARMETAAEPGTILITEETHKHIAPLFETQAQGPMQIKGKAEPVHVFRVLRLRQTTETARMPEDSASAPPRGRAAELSQLRTVLGDLRGGKGAVVALIGEAGLGKRRLLGEVSRLHDRDMTWVEAHCFSYTEGMSYVTLRELLRGLLSVKADTPPAEVAACLRNSLAELDTGEGTPVVPEVMYPYLAQLLNSPLDSASEARLKHLSADALQRQLLHAFATYVRARARLKPLALVWENLQWIDASSLGVLESLLRVTGEASLLMLLMFRPNEGRIAHLHQKLMRTFGVGYRVIELAPLTREDCIQLIHDFVTAHAPEHAMPLELRDRILARAEGNPFFIQEMLRAWVDRGPARANKSDVPETLQGVILSRIDRLSPFHKRALQSAAVIGRVFQRNVLAHVLDVTTDRQLGEALSELCERGFIVPLPNALDRELSFKHNLTHEVTYNSLLLAQRKALHKLIGETIEAQSDKPPDEFAATLAHHFDKAESHDKALVYLMRAGEHAARLYANTEAIAYYRRALDIAAAANAPCSVRLTAHEGLGDVHSLVGSYPASVEQYEQGLGCAGMPLQRAALQRKLGRVYERWGKGDRAIACFETGLREMREIMDAAETARIYTGMGLVYYRRSELNSALQLSELALDLMERNGDEWGVAQACNNLGIVHGQRGEWTEAIAYHHRCLSLWQQLGDTNGVAAAHNNLGLVLQQQGEWARAAEHYETSLANSEKVGNRHGLAFTYDNLGQVYQKQGRTREAMECLKKAVAILFEIGESQIVPEMWQSGAW